LPGGTTPLPGGTTPLPGSFPTTSPPTTPGAGFGTGGFGTGTNYAPARDPYAGSTPRPNANSAGPTRSVFGSGYHTGGSEQTIRSPELGPALPAGVQTVPDPDANQLPRSINKAPQLIDPRDKTAAGYDSKWAVVPAVWPTKQAMTGQLSERPVVATSAHESFKQPSPADYVDGGWKSAR